MKIFRKLMKGHLLITILCFSISSVAYEGERTQAIGQDYVNCASFYTILTWRLRQDGKFMAANIAAEKHLTAIALGRVVFAADDYSARFDLALADMVGELDDGMYNLSERYEVFCDNLLRMKIERILIKKSVAVISDVDAIGD